MLLAELGVTRYKSNALRNIITFAVMSNIIRYIPITFVVTSNITRYIPITFVVMSNIMRYIPI